MNMLDPYSPAVDCLEFLPPDPGLVERIRQGLDAHRAVIGARERIPALTSVPSSAMPTVGFPVAQQLPPRQASRPMPLRQAAA